MKVAHRKTLWIHTVFAAVMAIFLFIIALSGKNIAIWAVVSFFGLYLVGHLVIHYRRDDLNVETAVEYVRFIGAVAVVMYGSLA